MLYDNSITQAPLKEGGTSHADRRQHNSDILIVGLFLTWTHTFTLNPPNPTNIYPPQDRRAAGGGTLAAAD